MVGPLTSTLTAPQHMQTCLEGSRQGILPMNSSQQAALTSTTQVVMTSWAIIGLLAAQFPDKKPIERGVKLIMSRQQRNGEWLQEGIEGVFNKSV